MKRVPILYPRTNQHLDRVKMIRLLIRLLNSVLNSELKRVADQGAEGHKQGADLLILYPRTSQHLPNR
ncbi:hypothetical protein DUNSADRAFT_8716 [Dunaliella salina]|uniref:Uncharacterized protein n=1 Tax=Dunaliella salina TaxID=3046 RepID=A0ABQ7FSR7_DUNSA|nr:hypothetical protein DUNSADRAFT_8716 [Dunaliella salina]|eukprot:KAF5825556.1 hypothetical protein DUNSADRAFT_8716 [Dunaliella salina]